MHLTDTQEAADVSCLCFNIEKPQKKRSYVQFQASAAVQMTYSLFWHAHS
jgi:hypothetical protein